MTADHAKALRIAKLAVRIDPDNTLATAYLELSERCTQIEQWLDNNTTFYNVDADWPVEAHNVPVLAQVSERIWYHATDDTESYPFSKVIERALAPTNAAEEA